MTRLAMLPRFDAFSRLSPSRRAVLSLAAFSVCAGAYASARGNGLLHLDFDAAFAVWAGVALCGAARLLFLRMPRMFAGAYLALEAGVAGAYYVMLGLHFASVAPFGGGRFAAVAIGAGIACAAVAVSDSAFRFARCVSGREYGAPARWE